MDYTDIPNPADTADSAEARDDDADDASEGDAGPAARHRLQLVSNLVTLLVAVSAIGLSVWEGCETRRHNRLAVLPNLDVSGSMQTLAPGVTLTMAGEQQTIDEQVHFARRAFRNTGLGPAVVQKALVFRAQTLESSELIFETGEEGEAINLYTVDSLVAQIQDLYPNLSLFTGGIRQGAMLQAGDEWTFFEAATPTAAVPDSLGGLNAMRRLIASYSFVVCYCSVYGEDCDQEHIGADPPSNAVCDL